MDDKQFLVSPMARRTKEDTEKTYLALLDAATRVFSERGVANTTLNDIASAAGLTRGAVYWHFENKDALIKALWEQSGGIVTEAFVHTLSQLPENQALEYFAHELKCIMKRMHSDAHLKQSMRIIHSCKEFTDSASELQLYFRSRRENIFNALLRAIEQIHQNGELNQAYSPEYITNALWIHMMGLMEAQMFMPERDWSGEIDGHMDLILGALV